jgi:hypothetical protein
LSRGPGARQNNDDAYPVRSARRSRGPCRCSHRRVLVVGLAVTSWSPRSPAGVVRISLGSAIAQAAYGLAARIATELLTTGTYESTAGGINHATMNHALARTAGVSR